MGNNVNLEKIYFMNAGTDGTFSKTGKYYSTPEDAGSIFKFLDKNDIEKLVLYVHGGLVSEQNGMEAALFMKNSFADVKARRHVVSLVWETGAVETGIDILRQLSAGSLFNEALNFVIKLAAKKLGITEGRGAGGEVLSDATIAIEKQRIAPFEELDKEVGARGGGNDLEIDFEEESISNFYSKLEQESRALILLEGTEAFKNYDDANSKEGRGFLSIAITVAKITFAVLKRYKNKTHHDFYPTVMEETFRKFMGGTLGQLGWGNMKEKARKMFETNEGRSGNQQYVGTYFLSLLDYHARKRNAEGKKFEVELIGHSAGSIVLCHLLKAAAQNFPDLKFNTVFFLAPACRTELFMNTLDEIKGKDVFGKFKMFTMRKEREKEDHCIPAIYTHSLLYLVSGLFEEETDAKILGLHEQFSAEGRYADFSELKAARDYIKTGKLVLSDDILHSDLNMRCNALKHGSFDNDKHTIDAILQSL